MPCSFCGEGDRWTKTCLETYGRLRVCDLCHEALAAWLIIVPGEIVVAARCEGCGRYGNPREFQEVEPGGRKDAYPGICGACTERR